MEANNKNVTWMDARGSYTAYIFILASSFLIISMLLPYEDSWTALNVSHGVVSLCINTIKYYLRRYRLIIHPPRALHVF